MKRLYYISTLLLAVLCLAACTITISDDGEIEITQTVNLKVEPSSLQFTADGSTQSVKITTDSESWKITASADWATLSANTGKGDQEVSVTVGANSGERRQLTLTVADQSGSKKSAAVTVTQEAKEWEEQAVVPSPAAFDGNKRSSTTYQLLIYSFADSDGDGVGDFKGIQNKLDYLDALGVTALWLSPAHPTSSYHAYDVNDYYTVNPLYGTEADFKALIDAAHAKGIKIYMDYVLNHSGKNNPWFLNALADPDSKYRDYYFFSSNPSADYKNFPMLKGTAYQPGEWKQATTGSPVITITKTDEAVKTGSASWNLWFWKDGGSGQALKFVANGDGTYYLVVEMSGKHGLLLRKDDSWDAKFGAGSGSLIEGTPYEMQPNGGDLFFTGNGRYKITLSNVGGTETLYYMGCFSDWMPDLNYGDVSVAETNACFQDLASSADKWINMGVDGLRLDAVKHICGGINSYNNSSNITLLGKWYDHCNATYKNAGHSDNIFMVAEAWDGHNVEKTYYKGLTSCFEFDYGYNVRDILNNKNASGFATQVAQYVTDHTSVRADAVTSFFLSNHDQDRFGSNVSKNLARMKQAGAILLSGPGKPFVYQGEELGYYGTKSGGDEYVRTPMMWDKAGKQCAKKGVENKVDDSMLTAEISVEAQEAEAASILNVYKTWSRLRNTYPALAEGKMEPVSLGGSAIASWYMTSGNQKLLVVHNVSANNVMVNTTADVTFVKPIALLGSASIDGSTLTLGGNSSVVFEL